MSENNKKIRQPLNRKAFLMTLLLTLGIGVTVLVMGFLMYLTGVTREFFISTWNQANAEAAVLEQTEYREICDEILRIYDSIPEEEREDDENPEYLAKYSSVLNENFRDVQAAMRGLQNRNGPLNAFIVALDSESARMIYLIDSDPREASFYEPGCWDQYKKDEIEVMINGADLSRASIREGATKRVQAVLTKRPEFGPRCTAVSTLYETDRYVVVVCVDEKLGPLTDNARHFLTQYIFLLLAVTFAASLIGMWLMRKYLVDPINKMAEAATDYGRDKRKEGKKRHFEKLEIHTGDELEQLADALRGMEEDVADYMDGLKTATAERERINTELSLAARIQKSMLKETFPLFPDRREFDIYATMEPARVVGGDLYDMILIDEDHLAVMIADVSGKGIPAAFFMVASMIQLGDGFRSKMLPSEILEQANDRICVNNPEEMFVTVWLGILEISTGILTAANAGHEYPVLIRADGQAELIHDKHGFVVGGMAGMKYRDYTLQLEKGDRLFVYTDGVTEATSKSSELFGTDRMLAAASRAGRGADPRQVTDTVRQAISRFVGDAEQFDDITMVCLEYRGA